MTGQEFDAWRRRMGLNISQTADALGLSRATVRSYCRAASIPRIVGLACEGYEAKRREQSNG